MRAIVITKPGGPEVLRLVEREPPAVSSGQVRIAVRATAVNRLDLLQRMGNYPAPPGSPSDIPGVEYAGDVESVGDGVDLVKGDRVFGLVGGGAYAEFVTTDARLVARIPEGISYVQAAAIPEAFITAYDAMITQARLAAGEIVLIHAVGSGVGSAAVQIARAFGARSIGTARKQSKIDSAKSLGLDDGIVVADADFAKSVLEATNGAGVNVVLELVGGNYLPEDIECIATKGRIVLVGLLSGNKVELDLGKVLRKRAEIRGTVLRSRPLTEKIAATEAFAQNVLPLFASGKLAAVVDRIMPLSLAAEAHTYMAGNENFGKVVLEV